MGIGGFMTEENLYKTIAKEDCFEVREYCDLCLVKVIVQGPFETAFREGSDILKKYFDGNNYKKLKINYQSSFTLLSRVDGWEVSCLLPPLYFEQSAPKPIGDQILFEKMNSRKVVVHFFQGKSAYSTLMKKTEELKHWARKTNLKLNSNARVVLAKPTFLSLFRKNEIHFDSF